MGDISELYGVKKVFGNHPVSVSATKSMTGHLLGAAGAIESVISVLSVNRDIIPATINTENTDEQIPGSIHIVLGKSIEKTVRYALNNTFGFGGHTASSVFKKYEAD
jgi:3-oxoacyl-[acyl-carrier-protein] synthase II